MDTKTVTNLVDVLNAHYIKSLAESKKDIARRLGYFRDTFINLSNNHKVHEFDISELVKFEERFKKLTGKNMAHFVEKFDQYVYLEFSAEVDKCVKATMEAPYSKLFSYAQHNHNTASIKRIEHEFNVKLDKAAKRRIPQLIAIIKEHNLDANCENLNTKTA